MRISKDALKVLAMLHSLENERRHEADRAVVYAHKNKESNAVWERQEARWYIAHEAVERAEAILGGKA